MSEMGFDHVDALRELYPENPRRYFSPAELVRRALDAYAQAPTPERRALVDRAVTALVHSELRSKITVIVKRARRTIKKAKRQYRRDMNMVCWAPLREMEAWLTLEEELDALDSSAANDEAGGDA